MAGQGGEPFRTIHAKVTESVIGGHGDPAWTSFFQSRLVETDGGIAAEPMRWRSRLLSQARAEALIKVPEGRVRINAGEVTEVQVLTAP
jgi:molybdopterin biosynthesis enzyme